MRRDIDLIRSLLLQIENGKPGLTSLDLKSPNHSSDDIYFHLKMMDDADLIVAYDVSSVDSNVILPTRITWRGYEFLDAVRSDLMWRRIKNHLAHLDGYTIYLVEQIALDLIREDLRKNLRKP